MADRVTSITVAFNPDPARLAAQVAALRGQVDHVVIVDNGSTAAVAGRLRELESAGGPGVEVVTLARNEGVAAGFNRGIEAAAARASTFLLLLDHDSVPAAGMVQSLVAACRSASATAKVAAVGPRIRDSRDQHEFPFIRFGWLHNPRIHCATDSGMVACDFLISSGSLVVSEAFRAIGPFDEELFIDFVDLEWCCRARSMGFALYGVCTARLDHELGARPRSVAGGLRILVHSPERLYFMTRNRLLLYGRRYVPLKWKLKDVARGMLKVATSVLFVPPRAAYLRMTASAVRDAIRGKAGPRP